MKKIFPIVLFSAVMIFISISIAKADSGPFFLVWDGTCQIVKVYLHDSDNTVYGEEIGCLSGETHSTAGALTSPSSASLGYHWNGRPE